MSKGISRSAAIPILVGILVVVGIGMTAAALPFAEQAAASDSEVVETPEESEQQQGEGPSADPGNMSVTPSDGDEQKQEPLSTCIEPLSSTGGTMLVTLGFLGIVGLVFQRYNFSAALLVGWTALPPVALAYFLLTNCAGSSGPSSEGGGRPEIPGEGLALDVSLNVPPWLLLGVVGVVLVAAVGLMYRSVGEEDVVTPEEDIRDEPDLDAFAEAAGRAADRIEEHDVDVDNAVYRTWVEMTELIDVDDPDVYSAGEFASTAISLGMDESDVTELTRLFNEVRYGDRDAAAREDQALTVLRNIESQYGTEGSSSQDGTTGPTESDADRTEDE